MYLMTSIFILIIQSYYCLSHLCPRNTTYIESGDQCLFVLNRKGNFSQNKDLCEAKKATLMTVSSVENLKDLCNYAKHIFPQTGYAYFNAEQDENNKTRYLWPHNNKEVQFPQQYWMDRVPESLRCLELFIYKDYCKINDIPCWKFSWVVCEFLHPNLCDINNGGCEQICIARGISSRTCKCETGIKFKETKCVKLKTALEIERETKCPIDFQYEEDKYFRAGNCFRMIEGMHTYSRHYIQCQRLNAVLLTETVTNLQESCGFVTKLSGIHSIQVGIWLYIRITSLGDEPLGVWEYDSKALNTSARDWCPVGTNYQIMQRVALQLNNGTCCLSTQYSIRGLFAICQAKEKINPCAIGNGNCSKYCNTTDEDDAFCTCDYGFEELNGECVSKCKVNNGGCHHLCEYNENGEVTCSCRPGYTINMTYKTECDVIDGCMTNNGGCQQICKADWYGQIWCECREGYVLKTDKQECFNTSNEFESSDKRTSDITFRSVFHFFALFVAISFISIFSSAIYRKRRNTKSGKKFQQKRPENLVGVKLGIHHPGKLEK